MVQYYMGRTNAQLSLFQICQLCHKVSDGHNGQESSKTHLSKLHEHALLDCMVGPTSGPRCLTPQQMKPAHTFKGQRLTRSLMRAAWGSDPKNLELVARNRMQQLGFITVNGKRVDYDPSISFDLGCVTYDGSKYRESDVLVPWAALDEDDNSPVAPAPPLPGGHPVAPAPALPNGYPGSSDGRPGSSNDPPPTHQLVDPRRLEAEAMWWPVISMSRQVIVETSGAVVVVTCVYQWMWAQPVGWYVRVVETRERL